MVSESRLPYEPMKTINMGPASTRRRAIALGLMLTLGVAAQEALAGPVRDGPVHHESNIEASSHQSTLRLGHGNAGSLASVTLPTAAAESQPDVAPPARKTNHGHSGGEDHCAHVHDVALLPAVKPMLSTIVVDAPMTTCERHDDPSRTSLPDPPRA
jgi:hypothetical protein